MKRVGVKVIDRGKTRLLKELKNLTSGHRIKAGVPRELDQWYPDVEEDINTATVGFFQEFGTIRNAETAWLRNSISPRTVKTMFVASVGELKKMIAGSEGPGKVLESIRTQCDKAVKDSITNYPLIDTGLLQATVGAVTGGSE